MLKNEEISISEIYNLESIINYYIGKKTSAAFGMMLCDEVEFTTKTYFKDIIPFNQEFPPSNEIVLCSTFLKGEGDIRFRILYTLTENDAKQLAAKLLCTESVNEINDLSESSIKEVGNIMTGSFFNAICDETDFKIDLSTPDFIMGSITDAMKPIKDSIKDIHSLITTDVVLKPKNNQIKLRMVIMQEINDAKQLLQCYDILTSKINCK